MHAATDGAPACKALLTDAGQGVKNISPSEKTFVSTLPNNLSLDALLQMAEHVPRHQQPGIR